LKIQPQLDQIICGSPVLGTYPLPGLLRVAGAGRVSGIAVAKDGEQAFYLALLDGEPEGAVYADEKGELYGDKAVVHLTGREQFVVNGVGSDLVTALVMGCRIFEKSHIRVNLTEDIPEVGRKAGGVGVLTLKVMQNNEPRDGYRISIRKEGQVVASDVTTDGGKARFRLVHGNYDCIVQDRQGAIFSSRITFDATHAILVVTI